MTGLGFGPFVLNDTGLARDGRPVALGQRGLSLLWALAEADGAVDKAALLEAGWPGTVVEEGNLTVQIAALRKALGPRADGQEWIVTVPRFGYRLLRREPAGAGSAEPRLPSVAVLPFQNMSGDAEQDYFADGIVEDLITSLSRFKSLQVLSRQSSFALKGRIGDVRAAAREMGVRYLLEGSVRRAAERLRVTAQLIDGESGAHLWARKFDGPLADVFDMQDAITANVAAVIEPHIVGAEVERLMRARPASLQAYDLYLRALAQSDNWSPESNWQNLLLLERAMELDPHFVPAKVLAAQAREHRHNLGWPAFRDDDREVALRLIEEAIAVLGDDAQMLARAAIVMMQMGGEAERALATFDHAVALNPADPVVAHLAGIGHLLGGGDLDVAEAHFERSVRLAMRYEAYPAMTGHAHIAIIRGEYERAADYANRAVTGSPNFNPAHWMLISAYALQGKLEPARRQLAVLLKISPTSSIHGALKPANPYHRARLMPVIEGLRLAGMPE